MKKQITLLAILFAVLSCEKKQETGTDEKKTTTEEAATKSNASQQSFVEKQQMFDIGLHSTVVVDKTADNTAWLDQDLFGVSGKKNRLLLYSTTKDYYFLDLSHKESGQEVMDIAQRAAWLHHNQLRINHQKTAMYIESTHRFINPENRPAMYDMPIANYKIIKKVEEIISGIGAEYNDSTKQYSEYIHFDFGATPSIKYPPTYRTDEFHFSIPNFKSIVTTNNLKPTDQLAIGTVKIDEHNTVNFLWVVGTTAFYDFSNEPR